MDVHVLDNVLTAVRPHRLELEMKHPCLLDQPVYFTRRRVDEEIACQGKIQPPPSGVAAFMSAHVKTPYTTPSMDVSSAKGVVPRRWGWGGWGGGGAEAENFLAQSGVARDGVPGKNAKDIRSMLNPNLTVPRTTQVK